MTMSSGRYFGLGTLAAALDLRRSEDGDRLRPRMDDPPDLAALMCRVFEFDVLVRQHRLTNWSCSLRMR
jgi:hypothetical protein